MRTSYVLCKLFSNFTAFRYIDGNDSGLRILSAVRCSILKNRIANPTVCAVLDFTRPVQNATHSGSHNDRWQHECPDGYAMVGLYDNNQYKNVNKAKCCRLDGRLCFKVTVSRVSLVNNKHSPLGFLVVYPLVIPALWRNSKNPSDYCVEISYSTSTWSTYNSLRRF